MATSSILTRIRTLLDRTPPFDRLPEEERKDLLADLTITYYEVGEVIQEQRSTVHRGLYIVESGLVRLMDLDEQRLIEMRGEGDVFGYFGLIKGGAMLYEAKAVEPTVCALLKKERFQQLYDDNEEFASFFNLDLKKYLSRLGTTLDVSGAHLLGARRLHQLVHREPVTCAPATSVQEVARLMQHEHVEAVVIMDGQEITGIVTDKDLRDRILVSGRSFDTPVGKVMATPVYTISEDARVLDAVLTMLRHQVSRLVIIRQEGRFTVATGVLSDRDLAHFRGQDPVATLDKIQRARSTDQLLGIRTETNALLVNLYRQGVEPEVLNAINTALYDHLVVRVLELSERALREQSENRFPETPWTWVRLGKGGRRESILSQEKYGAILYANAASDQEARANEAWFNHLFEQANLALEACGFKTSGEATTELSRCHSLREWKKIYRTWIFEAPGEALKSVTPLFDFRSVYGAQALASDLHADIIDALNVEALDQSRSLLALMAENALEQRAPLSLFRLPVLDRTTEHGRTIDIWERGIRPIVDIARVLALEVRYMASTNTNDRLRHVQSELPELADVLGPAIDAYLFLVDFRLGHQLRAIEANEPLQNQVDTAQLTKVQRNLLHVSFDAVSDLQEAIIKRYGISRKWFS